MKGGEINVWKFMMGVNQYRIPCYQRNYSWTEKECQGLYDDMLDLYEQRKYVDKEIKFTHFIGSVVFGQDDHGSILIIDGQQRLTTMYLFYLALYRVAKEKSQTPEDYSFAEKINVKILEADDDNSVNWSKPHRFKFSSQQDQNAFDKLFAGKDADYINDSLLTKNYRYFYNRLQNEGQISLKDFYFLTQSVCFITVELQLGDDAQRIFESLNSKGLPLTVGDKICNFLLMGCDAGQAEDFYNNLWVPMEHNCALGTIDDFIRYYLTIKLAQPPKKYDLYADFKSYYYKTYRALDSSNNGAMLNELLDYSKLYVYNKNCSYDLSAKEHESLQKAIDQCLYRLSNYLGYEVRIPFTMHCMWLHKEGQITGAELLAALQMVENFLFRRLVCGIPTNSLNKLFAALPRRIAEHEGADFITKLSEILCSGGSRLPNDESFKQTIETADFYTSKSWLLPYIIERLESLESKEQCKIYGENLTCEHIMPQTLTDEWRAELGPDADAIHKEWQHRLANLTLTAYNSKYSNRPFAEKCTMEHGLASSPLHTNRAIASHEHWGLAELQQRAKELGEKACQVWPYPKHSD